MPDVIFEHSKVTPTRLELNVGANDIRWSYGLNTQTFPTYGGEVVQILSVFIEDLRITGEVRNYRSLERIYKWFVNYMHIASQGEDEGGGSYVQEPVVFKYPHRGWEMKIIPKSLPGFRYGREVVAPQYMIAAAVHEDDPRMRDITFEKAAFEALSLEGGNWFSEMTGDIGYDADNPFSDPLADEKKFDPNRRPDEIADYFNKLIPSYLDHDFEALSSDFGSKPMFLKQQRLGNSTQGDEKADKIEKVAKRKK